MNATVIGQPGYYNRRRGLPSRLAMAIGDRLTRQRLRFLAVSTIIVGCLLLLASFATTHQNRTANGLGLGSDYLAFYDAGTILNHYPSSRLYDLSLQAQLYHSNLPGEPDSFTLPFANAPFIALLMRPLAMLPYAASYAAWVAISLTIYSLGFVWIWRAAKLNSRHWLFGLMLALSFEPFVIECLHGGQISAIGFAAMCGAIALSLSNRSFTAGLVLSICIYKPTILPFILPMLLITRQGRTLAGFVVGCAALVGVSLAAVGTTACADYVRMLVGYAGHTTTASGGGFQTWKFVDLNSFLKLLGAASWMNVPMVALLAGLVLREMIALRPTSQKSAQRNLPLFWAAAITCTLVANLYVGVYDAILIVPAAALTCGALLRRDNDTGRNLPLRFRCLLLTVWVTPWVSGLIAREIAFQPFTLVLLAFGAYQLQLLRSRCETATSPSRVPTDRRTIVLQPQRFDSMLIA